MEELEATYQYQQIIAKDEIRVLRLEPGAFAEPLIGSLLVRKIGDDEENPPAYDCVSYAWGHQQNFTSFTCDGKGLRITVAVDEMLRHLREPMTPRHLWIDAICINQADNPEKSQQVRSMGKIYALAREVHVWLGPATEEEMDAVQPLLGLVDSNAKRGDVIRDIYFRAPPDNPTQAFLSLNQFVSRGWFTRRWVLQEVGLGRVVVVRCGDRKIRWDWFCETVHAIWAEYTAAPSDCIAHDLAVVTMETLRNIITMEVVRRENIGDLKKLPTGETVAYGRILVLLRVYHMTNCRDDRDRLYSLYGLGTRIHDEQSTRWLLSCPVDYGKHFSDTYVMFAGAAVGAGLVHNIMEHSIAFGGLSDQDESWPSWVPSWNNTRKMRTVGTCLEYLRTSVHPLEIPSCNGVWGITLKGLWKEDAPNIAYVHKSRELHLHGSIYRIHDTQSYSGYSDAISFFEAILGSQCALKSADMSRHLVVWVLSIAILNVPRLCLRKMLDESIYTHSLSSAQSLHFTRFVWDGTKRLFGIQSDEEPESESDLDIHNFTSEIQRLLQGYDAFCYEHAGSLTFGIAFAQLKPGDFVFRNTKAVNVYDSTSVFGLIIRPYQSPSPTSRGTFRLVGICVDFFPHVENPEIIEVILV